MNRPLEGVMREGVYAMLGGPNYETVAELKMLRYNEDRNKERGREFV